MRFVPAIPHTNEVEATGEYAGLKYTQEETTCQEAPKALDKTCEMDISLRSAESHSHLLVFRLSRRETAIALTLHDIDKAEHEHVDRQPNVRSKALHEDVARNSKETVRNEEDR